jgi:predicted RNase H-like HicB family nuclease
VLQLWRIKCWWGGEVTKPRSVVMTSADNPLAQRVVDKSRAGYIVVLERTRTGYSAYIPDLPGCVTTGRTLDLTKTLLDEAIVFHQQGLRRSGERVPRPRSRAELRRKGLVR